MAVIALLARISSKKPAPMCGLFAFPEYEKLIPGHLKIINCSAMSASAIVR
jgi:hypothetical protein